MGPGRGRERAWVVSLVSEAAGAVREAVSGAL